MKTKDPFSCHQKIHEYPQFCVDKTTPKDSHGPGVMDSRIDTCVLPVEANLNH